MEFERLSKYFSAEEIEKIYNYVLHISNALDITVDNIVITDEISNGSYERLNNTIYLSKRLCMVSKNGNLLTLFFILTHELRHAYQWQKKKEEYDFEELYKGIENLSISEYNSLKTEIDANAYATYVLCNMYADDFEKIKNIYKYMTGFKNTRAIMHRVEELDFQKELNYIDYNFLYQYRKKAWDLDADTIEYWAHYSPEKRLLFALFEELPDEKDWKEA